MIVGYDFFGVNCFSSDIPAVTSVNYTQVSNAIFDEFEVRESILPLDSSITVESDWQVDTRLLAHFKGDLEAGNIDNAGVKIVQFQIKRRNVGELTSVPVGVVNYENDKPFFFTDSTEPNGSFVYSLVPIGENGLLGKANDVTVTTDFVGWWIVDKDTMKVIPFDTILEGTNMSTNDYVQTTLNQGRIQIDTMSKYPQVYYTDEQYHTFTLSTAIIPSDYSYNDYLNLVNIITQKKPLIVKSGSGDIYVCDIYAPQKSSLLNAYKNNDYIMVQVNAMEVQDYDSFMSG